MLIKRGKSEGMLSLTRRKPHDHFSLWISDWFNKRRQHLVSTDSSTVFRLDWRIPPSVHRSCIKTNRVFVSFFCWVFSFTSIIAKNKFTFTMKRNNNVFMLLNSISIMSPMSMPSPCGFYSVRWRKSVSRRLHWSVHPGTSLSSRFSPVAPINGEVSRKLPIDYSWSDCWWFTLHYSPSWAESLCFEQWHILSLSFAGKYQSNWPRAFLNRSLCPGGRFEGSHNHHSSVSQKRNRIHR